MNYSMKDRKDLLYVPPDVGHESLSGLEMLSSTPIFQGVNRYSIVALFWESFYCVQNSKTGNPIGLPVALFLQLSLCLNNPVTNPLKEEGSARRFLESLF